MVPNNYDILNYLNLRLNPAFNCWEVLIIDQNITFYIDDADRNIITSPAIKVQYNEDTTDIECVTPNGIVKLVNIIMQREINDYVNRTGNTDIYINFINTIHLDCRRSNLIIENNEPYFEDQYENIEYIGVTRSRDGKCWRMRIRNPYTNEVLINYYNNPLEAAMSYDYYANQFFHNKVGITNYELGKYSQDVLDYYNITSRQNIPNFNPIRKFTRKYRSTSTNETGFYGGFKDRNGIATTFRALDKDGIRRVTSYAKDNSVLLEAVAKREEFILANNSKSISNAIYPKEYYDAKEKGKDFDINRIIAFQIVNIEDNPNSPANRRERLKKMNEEYLGKFKQRVK